ncbi:MAG: efflux RND transporter permease subunit, partial [Planctomycetaceae bacterium]
ICEVTAEVCGTKVQELKLAGPVIDGLTVDESSHRSLTKFALPSTILIFVICLLSLKSVIAALVVFLTACFCQALILAVIYYSGERLSALLIILPPLVQVLAVSGGIHLMNYYLNALNTMEPREAAVECFRRGWLPSMLSLGTTAMGTASLLVSGLQPIRLFGIYGTVGVLCTAAAVLTAIPCSMLLLGRKRASADQQNTVTAQPHGNRSGAWSGLTALLCDYNGIFLLLLFGLMGLAAAGLPDLKTSVRIETLYEPDSRIMQDYEWLEDRIGALVPIEVLLHFAADCQLSDRQRMDVLWKVDRVLHQQPTVKAVMSALTLFPDPPRMPGLSRSIQASLVNKGIRLARPQFEQAAMLRTTAEGDVWRLTARVSALAPLDYGDVLKQLEQSLVEPLEQAPAEARHQISISTSGIMPLVHQIQGQLLSDLFNSLMSALAVITLTMTLVQAGILNGVLAMASNVFPIVIAFGLMGLLAVPMDIGSVMTASIALGIAVDDTLHFLTFFRRELHQPGATRRSAVLATYLDCGPAMIQTSVSCGLGLLVFAFSDFVPTSRFAVLMAFLLALALAGDLLLLPALLLSPAGKLFESEPAKEA